MEKPRLIEDLGRLYPTKNSKQKTRYGIFECPYCLNQFKATMLSIKTGHTKTCGCMSYVLSGNGIYKHGGSRTRIYKTYHCMMHRCYDVSDIAYKHYGKKGVIVCDEWKNSFEAFRDWALLNGYSEKLTINRKDTKGNYTPDNCNWATYYEQAQNTSLIKSNNTSGYRGVYWHKQIKRWAVRIRWNGKDYNLKTFSNPESAAIAYNKFIIEHGTLHPLNVIPNN